jgi:hypothetical protein
MPSLAQLRCWIHYSEILIHFTFPEVHDQSLSHCTNTFRNSSTQALHGTEYLWKGVPQLHFEQSLHFQTPQMRSTHLAGTRHRIHVRKLNFAETIIFPIRKMEWSLTFWLLTLTPPGLIDPNRANSFSTSAGIMLLGRFLMYTEWTSAANDKRPLF